MKENVNHTPKVELMYQRLNTYLLGHPDRVRAEVKQFKQEAADNYLRYAGMALLVAFYPFIIAEEQVRFIAGVTESMIRLMEKITHLFLQEPLIQRQFPFSPEQLELIKVDPGYRAAIPCGRFDSFYDGGSLLFSELNTDGSSGMDGADRIARIYLSSPSVREVFADRRMGVFDINRGVLDTLVECHRQFTGGASTARPRIAIVDWREVRTAEEFLGFAEFCRENGYEAVVADPRELEYNGSDLSHKGLKIDIVYRRVVSREYVQQPDEVEAMTRAFKEHAVCVVGSFRSDIAFSKKVFAVARSPRFSAFFTEEERRLAREHIPWTHSYDEEECEFDGRTMKVHELARERKDDFVLKPSYLYEGKGVKVGALTDPEEWEKLTVSARGNDYVLQQRIDIPSMPVAVWNEQMNMEQRWIHLGEFVFGGKFRGLYCRAADRLVIDRRSKELLVPCLVFKE